LPAVKATLYVGPASHPSMAARLMLEHKGIPYKRRDLIFILSKGILRAARFPGVTVPALKLDGKRVQGTRQISRELDRVKPDPPLFPADAEQRLKVEEAERWGDAVLQPAVRRIIWNALRRNRADIGSYLEGARIGVPVGLAVKTAAPVVALSARFNKADDENVRGDLAALPEMLDHVDALIKEGVISGPQPNAADFQIATSLRLAMTMDDLRPAIEDRPAGELAMRLAPDFPGHAGSLLPPDWLQPLAR
jgi:glutathione S-transferase